MYVDLFVCAHMLLPAGEVPCGCKTVAGDTLAVPTVVTFINLTRAASVLRWAAAQLGAIFTL